MCVLVSVPAGSSKSGEANFADIEGTLFLKDSLNAPLFISRSRILDQVVPGGRARCR